MRKRMKNDKGFTLAELLIVVAIIAVLVAVSIPIFTNQLEKSREATDVANFRAAKAAYVVALLDGTMAIANDGTKYYYHADTGLVDTSEPSPYGEGTTKNPYKATSAGEIYPSPYDPASDRRFALQQSAAAARLPSAWRPPVSLGPRPLALSKKRTNPAQTDEVDKRQ